MEVLHIEQKTLAHKTEDGRTQSVYEHNRNVAMLAYATGADFGFANVSHLGGFYHDAGKNSSAFQTYLLQDDAISPTRLTRFRRGEIDHSYGGARFIMENAAKDDAIDRFTAELSAVAIASHHGTYDWLKENGDDYFEQRIKKDQYYEEIRKHCRRDYFSEEEFKTAFAAARQEVQSFISRAGALPEEGRDFYCGMLARTVQSVLIDMDRCDTRAFAQNESYKINRGNREFWQKVQENLEQKLRSFSKSTPLGTKRAEISEECFAFAQQATGIYQLVVPTGGGKTLASLRFALEHAICHDQKRIFYIAPFNSILEQNSEVFREIINDDTAFLEHHCNVEDDSEAYELLTENWDCPVVATTMVQFLNALFSHKTSNIRRLHQLTNAVIIVDEIQSLPLKCIRLFNQAMNFLGHLCHSTIVLCSATQPILEDIKNAPILFSNPKSILTNVDLRFEDFKRTEIIDATDPPRSNEEAVDYLLEQFQKNGNVLMIVNTKNTAMDMFQRLAQKQQSADGSNAFELRHLSTNMCPANRAEVLKEIRELLRLHKPLICVTTQIIEAGVDISFDCVVRSLAGLDNIAQAAGRCNRNALFHLKFIHIIKLKEENLTRLQEIQEAQIATKGVFRKKDSVGDLLSPKAMEQYYKKYYFTQQKEMSFIIKKKGFNLLDLLSTNLKAKAAYRERYGAAPPHFFTQAFRTAGDNFEVIENNTVGVLVPYNAEAKKLLESLGNRYDTVDLKAVQKYTVAIYPYVFENLHKHDLVYMPADSGIWILREENYNNATGLVLQGKKMSLDSL